MASQPVCYQKALDASNKQVISSNKALADSKAKEGCSKDEQKKLKMWYWVIIGIAGFLLIGLAVLLSWHFNKKLKDEIKLYKPQPPLSEVVASSQGPQ
jgi:flagellar basal body-associated protein FliL